MRLPSTPQLNTKDGISNKNARLTNSLKETTTQGEFAVSRPGLLVTNSYAGLGNGLIVFDGRLLTIVDDTIYDDEWDDLWWPLDASEWSIGYTYGINDYVWYGGELWFSVSGGNIGNAPSISSIYWDTSRTLDTYDEGATYSLGDSVLVGGTTYYLYTSTSTGNPPLSNPLLWRTTAPNLNLTMSGIAYSPSSITLYSGPQTATWSIYDGAIFVGFGSGTLTASLDGNVATLTASNWPRESTDGLGTIFGYEPMPSTPPYWTFSGTTWWSGTPPAINNSWAPSQSSGAWVVVSP